MKPGCCHNKSSPESFSALTGKLREQSVKITGPRQAILQVMQHHQHPLSIKEILGALPAGLCDLATVYRSMHTLEEKGLVKRFDFGDRLARFELVLDTAHAHHHHLICTECSAVVEIDECFPRELEERIAQGNGFKAITHKLEFFGICPQCQ